MITFKEKCQELKHYHCRGCRMVSLNMKIDKKGYCSSCSSRPSRDFLLENKLLPIWYDEGVPQYTVPVELSNLTHAEKMLIQRVSPMVPLHHIKNGVFGLSGHVCAFEQEIKEMVTILPRFGRDTTVIRVLQQIRAEVGSTESMPKAFKVRKREVIIALNWLKKFNKEYADIVIDESRLDWIKGEEGNLDVHAICTPEMKTKIDDKNTNADMGPNSNQCLQPQVQGDNINCYGYIPDGGPGILSPNDNQINNELQRAIHQSPNKQEDVMEWPQVSDMPVSEFADTRIFARAFPWLFPGGYGDIKDFNNADANLGSWGKRLLYYEDGRFAKDKLFEFFCMNYIIRHRNSSSGKFFIDCFQRDVPDTLEELKKTIQTGDMSFVNHLTYWNKRIKGSNPYWFQKRSEVYTWINEHMQLNHGAPTFFITLSCAEYFWPDVIDLLKERLKFTNENIDDIYVGSPKLIQLVNDYTIVIQEYFQKRVELWLETVGKGIFDIKHYWIRYEFAPGRGQIHAHLLAIPNNHDIYIECHQLLKQDNGQSLRATTMSEWAASKFGLTCCVDNGFNDRDTAISNSSIQIRFKDVNNTTDDILKDGFRLLHACQQHACSDFCMKKGNKKRYVKI